MALYQKSDKAPFIIHADLQCMIEKIDGCKNNTEHSYTTKVSKHIPLGFSPSTISLFRSKEKKYHMYRGKYFRKTFCEFLREHAMKRINSKKKKIKLLRKAQLESYENAKICYICKKIENKCLKDEKYCNVRDHYHDTAEYRGASRSTCN